MTLETITLNDETSGSRARILPGRGFNCFSFEAATPDGRRELLWSAADFASGGGGPSHSGIPLLFPFPGRIRQGRFRFDGRDFSIPAGDGRGNAIHGFVLDRPWNIRRQTATQVTGEFHASAVDPKILDLWPADFRLIVTYRLWANTLTANIEFENPSQTDLPFGFGAHPYFRLPLAEGSRASECRVTVPVTNYWELVDLLPSGKQLPIDRLRRLNAGIVFDDHQWDDVFSGVEFDGVCATARIFDPLAQRTVSITFDNVFRQCVVYTPPHREAICIEPYTCVPDPFWLNESGIDSGLRILKPGESSSAMMSIRLDG